MPNERGGIRVLTGYLYQVVGMCAITAQAAFNQPATSNPDELAEIDTIVRMPGVTESPRTRL